MPQRGYVCKAQGCRALAATLRKEKTLVPQPQRGCVSEIFPTAYDTTALRLKIILFSHTQGSRSGNPGLYRRSAFGAKRKLRVGPPVITTPQEWC